MENRPRLFIKIHFLDNAQQYTLFKIISLPSVTLNGTHGVSFTNLPDFLAVTQDLEGFIELSETDVMGGSKTARPLCTFNIGINKNTSWNSCAMALFMGDEKRKESQCVKEVKPWKGSETVYLGKTDGY